MIKGEILRRIAFFLAVCFASICLVVSFDTLTTISSSHAEERKADAMAKEVAILIRLKVIEDKLESYEILEDLGE